MNIFHLVSEISLFLDKIFVRASAQNSQPEQSRLINTSDDPWYIASWCLNWKRFQAAAIFRYYPCLEFVHFVPGSLVRDVLPNGMITLKDCGANSNSCKRKIYPFTYFSNLCAFCDLRRTSFLSGSIFLHISKESFKSLRSLISLFSWIS